MGWALAGSLLHLRPARADSELEALLSESVESTSGKAAGGADSAPALSLSVTAEDLRRHGIRTLAEAYNFLTMGLVSEDPLGDPEVGSRGVLFPSDRGKHVLLLLDGHTLVNILLIAIAISVLFSLQRQSNSIIMNGPDK